MKRRIVMLVDFDYFYAQCEERRTPDLRDKAIVVCVYSGRSEDSGAVSTSNYVARKYGITSGIPIYLAKKKLENKDAVFLPVDRRYYEEASENIMKILRGYADFFEQAGIDEAYLDISESVSGNFGKAKELAQKMKDDVKALEKISCSIGIGPNKLIAKIAADIQKPDGLTVVNPESVSTFLSSLPIGRLIGVGVKTEKKIEALGIKTIGDLAKYDVQKLIEAFGKNFAAYLHNSANGVDFSPVQERSEVESISRIATLKEDTRSGEVIIEKANQLCDTLHSRLVLQKASFKSIGIVAVMKDMSIHSRSLTLENPINESNVLKKNVKELFEKLLKESELEFRRIGVKVANFAKREEKQEKMTSFI